tara:strand:+ start:83 stop:823 length:741 start_codon:yes stop_codon:yes gene_type:complete
MTDTINKLKNVLLENIDQIDDLMPYIMTFSNRLWYTKMIQQYEIWKLSSNVPGHVVELGVHFGESFFHWAKFVEIYNMGERETRVIGFDTFSGFPSISNKDVTKKNQKEVSAVAVKKGGFDCGPETYKRLLKMIDIFEEDHFIPRKKRLELVKGDILKTVPKFVKDNPGLRISLLHLDCDLYEPTLCGLEHLYPLVSPGGVIILDEYGQEKFAGESKAFDEYFGKNPPKLQKSQIVSNPSGWFIKG